MGCPTCAASIAIHLYLGTGILSRMVTLGMGKFALA